MHEEIVEEGSIQLNNSTKIYQVFDGTVWRNICTKESAEFLHVNIKKMSKSTLEFYKKRK